MFLQSLKIYFSPSWSPTQIFQSIGHTILCILVPCIVGSSLQSHEQNLCVWVLFSWRETALFFDFTGVFIIFLSLFLFFFFFFAVDFMRVRSTSGAGIAQRNRIVTLWLISSYMCFCSVLSLRTTSPEVSLSCPSARLFWVTGGWCVFEWTWGPGHDIP